MILCSSYLPSVLENFGLFSLEPRDFIQSAVLLNFYHCFWVLLTLIFSFLGGANCQWQLCSFHLLLYIKKKIIK